MDGDSAFVVMALSPAFPDMARVVAKEVARFRAWKNIESMADKTEWCNLYNAVWSKSWIKVYEEEFAAARESQATQLRKMFDE